jgi:hypothetical protein
MYKVNQNLFLLYFTFRLLLGHIFHMASTFHFFFSQCEILIVGDVTVKMYYGEFPLEVDRSPVKLKERMEKVME